MKSLEEQLKKIISDVFNCEKKKIKLNSGPIKNDIPRWDSFGNLELILNVEKKLNIKFLSLEINKINNFEELMKYSSIAQNRKKKLNK
jgi:acyl carrier protein